MRSLVIEATALQRSFGAHAALDGLDLSVPSGSVFGFLGRNGAGKTTTIKILMGLLKSDAGSVMVLGQPIASDRSAAEIRRRVGFVTEDKELYPYMTVEQIIRFTRPFFPGWRDDLERRYLRVFDLPPRRKIPDLSKGMRSKLMLLLAMSHGAELLILDEPTDGLDPVAIEEVLHEIVLLSADEGTTVFFSSHQLAEVEQVAEHVLIIDSGHRVVDGPLDDLKASYKRIHVVLGRDDIPDAIQWGKGVEHVRREGRTISILVSGNVDALVRQAQSLPGSRVEVFAVSLKEIFLDHVRRT